MRKRVKPQKITILKHGNTYVPPVEEIQEPFYVCCPECGETWTGYDADHNDTFKKLWRVQKVKCPVWTLGVDITDVAIQYICPECGCIFQILDRKERSYNVSDTLFKGVKGTTIGSFVICLGITATIFLADDGSKCPWVIPLVLLGIFLASFAALVGLFRINACGLRRKS